MPPAAQGSALNPARNFVPWPVYLCFGMVFARVKFLAIRAFAEKMKMLLAQKKSSFLCKLCSFSRKFLVLIKLLIITPPVIFFENATLLREEGFRQHYVRTGSLFEGAVSFSWLREFSTEKTQNNTPHRICVLPKMPKKRSENTFRETKKPVKEISLPYG